MSSTIKMEKLMHWNVALDTLSKFARLVCTLDSLLINYWLRLDTLRLICMS